MAGEISLLYKLSNTIRRASKESQNPKAEKLFRITDDEGNDAGPMLKQIFTSYLVGRFPQVTHDLCERLASTVLLRRKRILYRRSRYGERPIRTKRTIPQPEVRLPVAKSQPTEGWEHIAASTINAVDAQPAKSAVLSLAPSATTLAANDYKKASSPSVISISRTVALGNHDDLVFPPAPVGHIKQRYRKLKEQRQDEHKAFLNSLPDYALYIKHREDPHQNHDNYFSKLKQEISEAEAKLRATLKADWDSCAGAVAEFTCPFCLYALPGLYLTDDKKWK